MMTVVFHAHGFCVCPRRHIVLCTPASAIVAIVPTARWLFVWTVRGLEAWTYSRWLLGRVDDLFLGGDEPAEEGAQQ